MIYTDETRLSSMILHQVGNKTADEGVRLSTGPMDPGSNIRQLLLHYFLTPFKSEEYFRFHHDSGLHMNEVFSFVSSIFDEPESLHEHSIDLAKHLYEQSTHPKIKSGEFYVVYFTDLLLDGELLDGVGLFKSESKETYLKVYPDGADYQISADSGININKLDKGCLIFNTEQDQGYVVAAVDNLNRNTDARYWFDRFLQIRQREDKYYHTEQVISLTKDFVTNRLPEEFEMDRADQAEILNDSAAYLKENETFNMKDFAEQVIRQPEAIESFMGYREDYEKVNDLELAESFDIAGEVVKKKSRYLRSVIKLDKNFHIYIHGKRERVKKGVDPETGLNYYQLFYEQEE